MTHTEAIETIRGAIRHALPACNWARSDDEVIETLRVWGWSRTGGRDIEAALKVLTEAEVVHQIIGARQRHDASDGAMDDDAGSWR